MNKIEFDGQPVSLTNKWVPTTGLECAQTFPSTLYVISKVGLEWEGSIMGSIMAVVTRQDREERGSAEVMVLAVGLYRALH